jgi:plastocyanin
MRAPAAFALAALSLAAGAAPAAAESTLVSAGFSSFSPAHLDILVGDNVAWRNNSVRTHDIQSLDAGFDSGRISPREGFAHVFATPGPFAYECTIHDGMRGEVIVHSLLLRGAERAVRRGTPVELRARAPDGVTEVTIEENTGAGFHAVATARPDAAGAFVATVVPLASADYRAVAGELVSSPLRVEVSDEAAVALRASARDGGALVRVRAPGAPPGTRVVLQLRLRERFGWWPVGRARLDDRSRASFVLKRTRPVRARAVLVGEDWATPLSMSAALTVQPGR